MRIGFGLLLLLVLWPPFIFFPRVLKEERSQLHQSQQSDHAPSSPNDDRSVRSASSA